MAIAVSTAWKNAIQAQFRYPAYIRMTLNIVQPGMREGSVVTASSTEPITNVNVVKDGTVHQVEPVATFESNRWIGDGSMYLPSEIASDNSYVEWWSQTAVNPQARPRLTFVFDKAYTIPGLYCTWDTATDSWPTDLTVQGYNTAGTLIRTYRVGSINSSSGYFDAPFEDVKRVDLIFLGWSKSSWRARVEEVIFGLSLSFSNDKITSATYDASSSPVAQELPVAKLQMTLNNFDNTFDPMLVEGYSKYLSERQLVEVSWGFGVNSRDIEWMAPWPMYLQSWSIPNDAYTVQLTATNRLEFLTREYIRGVYDGSRRSLSEIMLDILESSDLTREQITEEPWEFADALDTLYTTAPAPRMAANALIQLLAGAAGCFVDINPRNGYIRIRNSTEHAEYDISTQQQLGNPSVSIDQRLKSISAYLYSYTQRTTQEQVCSLEYSISGTQVVTIEFGPDTIVADPTVEVAGADLLDMTCYARGAELVLHATSPTFTTIVVNGYIVDSAKTLVPFYTDVAADRGIELVIDNPFITETETLQVAASSVLNYYQKRKTVSAQYLGYPELEVGDSVDMTTRYGKFEGVIEKLQLTFNGGFTGVATIKAEEGKMYELDNT